MAQDKTIDWRIIAGGAAVIVLLVLVYAGFTQSRMAGDFERDLNALQAERDQVAAERDDLAGLIANRDAVEERVRVATEEAERLEDERSTVASQLAAMESMRTDLDAEIAEMTGTRDALRAESAALAEEARPLREEIDGFAARRSELETEIATQTAELAEIGARLEQARANEAALAEALAQMNADRLRLTADLEEAEGRLAASLEEETAARDSVAAARQELGGLEEDRVGLEAEVATLEERRTLVRDELAAAEEQRSEMQSIVAALAGEAESRAARLSDIERRIASLMDESRGEGPAEAEKAQAIADPSQLLTPGEYASGDVRFAFAEDGVFTVEGGIADGTEGRYSFDGAKLVIEADGVTLRCGLRASEEGFALVAEDDACGVLDGETFRRAAAN